MDDTCALPLELRCAIASQVGEPHVFDLARVNRSWRDAVALLAQGRARDFLYHQRALGLRALRWPVESACAVARQLREPLRFATHVDVQVADTHRAHTRKTRVAVSSVYWCNESGASVNAGAACIVTSTPCVHLYPLRAGSHDMAFAGVYLRADAHARLFSHAQLSLQGCSVASAHTLRRCWSPDAGDPPHETLLHEMQFFARAAADSCAASLPVHLDARVCTLWLELYTFSREPPPVLIAWAALERESSSTLSALLHARAAALAIRYRTAAGAARLLSMHPWHGTMVHADRDLSVPT